MLSVSASVEIRAVSCIDSSPWRKFWLKMNKIVTLVADIYQIGIYYVRLYDTSIEFIEHSLQMPFSAYHPMPYKVGTRDNNIEADITMHPCAGFIVYHTLSLLTDYPTYSVQCQSAEPTIFYIVFLCHSIIFKTMPSTITYKQTCPWGHDDRHGAGVTLPVYLIRRIL